MSKETIRTQRRLYGSRSAGPPADTPTVASNGGVGATPAPIILPAEVLTRGPADTGMELSSREARTLQRALRLIKDAR